MWYTDSQLVDCGIDYFTTTAIDPPTSKLLLLHAEQLCYKEEKAGFFISPWRMKGYSGWQCGRVQWGWREDGAIVRFSGSLAASEWFTLYQDTERCSRIDLQATYRLVGHPKLAVSEIHTETSNYFAGLRGGPKITLWTDNRDGATLYLGCRQSSVYFRAYNKEAESGDEAYKSCIRLELEIKGGLTSSVIAYLLGSEFVGAGILALLAQYMTDRGISSNLPPGARGSFYEPPELATDEVKSLRWMAEACRPSVERLIERGRMVQVLDALGLSEILPDCQKNCDTL